MTRPGITIIGAGITGLTAAITIGEGVEQMLKDGRIKIRPDMTVLESTNWIGGRARTQILSNGVTVDAGPHWFHGGKKNPLYQWACKRHYDLGRVTVDTATRRFNQSSAGALPPEQREWALNRLFELYAVWKAREPERDISLRDLAELSKSKLIITVAEERANNWMAVDHANLVSSDEFWGDDAGSGGMQLEHGVESLIANMTREAEFYKADIQLRQPVRGIFRAADNRFKIVGQKQNTMADYVINTASIGVLKQGGMALDTDVQSQLAQVLDGLTIAKSTKVFVPLHERFFTDRNIAPDTFVTFYDRSHAWLLHLRTDGKPIVTIFASGAMSDLVEAAPLRTMEAQMLDLLDRVELTNGARDALDGRVYRTDWGTDENFMCAYSAVLPGVKRRNPLVVGNLVFAGEAFVQDLKKSPGQMTGAWESGRIAGRKILRKLALAG